MKRWLLRINGLLFGLLIVLALGGLGWLSQTYRVSWQWGTSTADELTPGSRRLLAATDGEVTAVAFVPDAHLLSEHLRKLLTLYSSHKADFRFELINPEARPDLVRALGVQRVGEIVLQYGERQERVGIPTEARVSAALERLVRGHGAHVAYLVGHGERDLLGEANHDLGVFGERLARKGYQLRALSPKAAAIPDDTALLVMSAPRTELAAGVRRRVLEYLERGGRLLVLADPGETARLDFLGAALPLAWRETPVSDPQAAQTLQIDDPHLVLVDSYPPHAVTTGLDAPVLLPRAAALSSDSGGWAMAPLLVEEQALIGAAFTREQGGRQQRIAVIGDGDFLSNTYIGNGANLPLGLNLVDWLTESELFLDSYTRATPDQTLELTPTALALIGFGFLFAVPAAFLALGALQWWRRRRG